jgi:MFS family permease
MNLDKRYKLHQALHMGSISCFGPVVTLYCLHKGMNFYQIGLFFGAYFLAITVFELPSGAWADRLGRLKVFYWAKGLDCLNLLLLIVCDSVYAIIITSFIGGIGRALGSGTLESWYVEQLKSAGRSAQIGQQLSATHAWIAVGMACGSLAGAGLVLLFGQKLSPHNPYLPTLTGVLIFHLVLFFTMPWFYREGERLLLVSLKADSAMKAIKRTLIICWGQPLSQAVLVLQLIFGMILTSSQTYWQVVLQQLLQNDSPLAELAASHVMLFGLVAVLFFSSAAVSANIVKRLLSQAEFKVHWLILALFVVSSLLLMLMAYASSAIVFIGLYIAFGFFMFALKPLLATIMHQQTDDKHRATSLSLLSLMFNLGGALVGILLSQIAEYFSIEILWIMMGILGLLAAFGYRLMVSDSKAELLPAPQNKS